MAFLTWNNQQDAEDSLASVDAVYGCPYILPNGYRMDQWDLLTKADGGNKWGFFSPEHRPGKTKDDLMRKLVSGYTEHERMPSDWMPPGLDENGIPPSLEFSPKLIAGLKLWLDAADLETIIEEGGSVSQWNDKSPYGNNATQSITSKQPVTGSRNINGHNVIEFWAGMMMVLDSQPIIGTEARTIIIVGYADDKQTQNFLISLSDDPLNIPGGHYRITAEIAVRIHGAHRLIPNHSIEDGINAAIITATQEANSNIQLNANNFQIYKNGVLLSGGTPTNPTTPVNTQIGKAAIGDDASYSSASFLDGVIGEIIIYDRVLSDPDRKQVERYLSNKWTIPVDDDEEQ